MRQKIKMLIVTMLLMIVAISQSFFVFAKTSTKASKPKLSKTKIVMNEGETKKLHLKGVSQKAKVNWKSGNSNVVKVTKQGQVVAKQSGKATIKVTVKQNRKKTVLKCRVTIKKNKETRNTEPTDTTPLLNLPKKNNLFDGLSNNVTCIRYAISEPGIYISYPNRIANVINYLSSLEIEPGEYFLKAGGCRVKFITPEREIYMGLFSNDFVYDGKYYVIKDSDIEITLKIKELLGK